MKKLGVLIGLLACVLFTWTAVAGEPGKIAKGRRVYGEVNLPLGAFLLGQAHVGSTARGTAVISTGVPRRGQDDLSASIIWGESATSPAQTTFKVPSDYNGDGRFIVGVTNSNVTTVNYVDFEVVVAAPGAAAGSTLNQTAVACTDGTAGYLNFVTLTPVTSFDSLAAGDNVTFRIWRDNDSLSVGVSAFLELKSATFIYTRIGN